MKRLLLPKTQRNEVLATLRAQGVDAAPFRWAEAAQDRIPGITEPVLVSELVHRPTGYRFCFDIRGADHFDATFSPGRQAPEEYQLCRGWAHMLALVRVWAERLKQEIDAPDLWAPYLGEDKLLRAPAAVTGDDPFTPEEKQQVYKALDEIKQHLMDHTGVEERFHTLVNQRFDYLRHAVGRSRRVDWLNIFVGTIVSVLVNAAIPSDKARELLQYASEALSTVFDFTKLLA